MRRVLVLVAFCVSTGASAQQPPVVPVIAGQVLAADSDTPLRRARVNVSTGTSRPDPVLTDNDGRFSVEVPGGGIAPFTLTITKGGFVTATASVPRKDAQAPLLVRLPRGAAISGIVVDQGGAPVVLMSVTASRVDDGAGAVGLPAQYSATTDDLGEFRLAGLSSGRYEVWAGQEIEMTVPVDPGGTAVTGRPSTATNRAPVRVRVGSGPKSIVRLETAEEVGGVQLTAPAESATDAMLRLIPADSPVRALAQPTPQVPLPPRGRAAGIRGSVLTAARKPIAGASVRVVGSGVDQVVRTDKAGAFALIGLTSGRYTLEAAANGYMSWNFGQQGSRQPGRPIAVATDQIVENVEIVLPQGRVVSGVIVDEHGEPVHGAQVQALQLDYIAGRMTAVQVALERPTDDRGRYRIWGLQPGSYLVAASLHGLVPSAKGQPTEYATIYFPGTPTVASALPIDVREDATANLTFTPLGLTEVRGLARDGDTGPLVSGTARLIESRRSGAAATAPRSATIQMDGTFIFRNVPPGEYVAQVRGDGPGRTGLFGTQELVVGTQPAGVTVRTSYGTSVEGRIVFEGAFERACGTTSLSAGVSINADCVRGVFPFDIGTVALDDRSREPPSGVVIAGSDFFITNLFGPTAFALQRTPGDGWYLKSWMINGSDIADGGFDFGARQETITDSEIVLSRNGATISGRVDGNTRSIDDYSVVVFPASRDARFPRSRRMKFSRSAIDGTFSVGGLPAGDYFVAAVSRLQGTRDAGEWQNPDVLLQLEARAERLTLSEGQSRTVTLRLIER
jgi:hypothetical protein